MSNSVCDVMPGICKCKVRGARGRTRTPALSRHRERVSDRKQYGPLTRRDVTPFVSRVQGFTCQFQFEWNNILVVIG